jgi:hypothetical protein
MPVHIKVNTIDEKELATIIRSITLTIWEKYIELFPEKKSDNEYLMKSSIAQSLLRTNQTLKENINGVKMRLIFEESVIIHKFNDDCFTINFFLSACKCICTNCTSCVITFNIADNKNIYCQSIIKLNDTTRMLGNWIFNQ